MPEICCPYCNSRNVLKTVYAYRGVNKKHNKSINYNDYLKNGTILMQKKIKKKYDVTIIGTLSQTLRFNE